MSGARPSALPRVARSRWASRERRPWPRAASSRTPALDGSRTVTGYACVVLQNRRAGVDVQRLDVPSRDYGSRRRRLGNDRGFVSSVSTDQRTATGSPWQLAVPRVLREATSLSRVRTAERDDVPELGFRF